MNWRLFLLYHLISYQRKSRMNLLFAIALNFAIQYNILFDYEKEAFVNIQPECWYKDLANFFFYSFGVLTSSVITEIAAASILAKVLVTLEVLSAFIFIILIIGNYKAIGESLSNLRFLHGENKKKRVATFHKGRTMIERLPCLRA